MKIEGEFHKKYEIKSFGENFKKISFSVKHIDKDHKTQFLLFEAHNGKIELLEGYSPGDKIIVKFKLTGREYKNKKGEDVIFDQKEVVSIESPPTIAKIIEKDYKNKKLSF